MVERWMRICRWRELQHRRALVSLARACGRRMALAREAQAAGDRFAQIGVALEAGRERVVGSAATRGFPAALRWLAVLEGARREAEDRRCTAERAHESARLDERQVCAARAAAGVRLRLAERQLEAARRRGRLERERRLERAWQERGSHAGN